MMEMKFLELFPISSSWDNHFKSKYSLERFDTDWIISDRLHRAQSFHKLLAKHKGSFMFIYLWSVPCPYHVKEMPAFIQLMEDYAHKNIDFIPIAISVGSEQWKWRENKYFGDSNHESYQIDSLSIQKIKRRFIPKFLLFDPDGNLLHGNAPRANSDEVRPFLDGYLINENRR